MQINEMLRKNAAAMAKRDDVDGIANSLNLAADRIEALEAELETMRARPNPRCASCQGSGQVSRSWGFIPCNACSGKGF